MAKGEGRDFEFRNVREMNPFAVQPSYAPMGGDYELSPEVLAQLADLGVNPYGGGQSPTANPVNSPLAVRGMPEMDPAEFSSLAVPGVPAAVKEQAKADLLADPNLTVIPGSLDDLSQFGGLGGLDGYEANSSGAPVGMPTSYAFPENYGNPKNKIYNLTAGPEDAIRLKFVDGTTMFEGKGPEAAAKAAAIVQELGKKFNTQSTWILDKQTAGGDWKQVSQDTVGEKKKTALNSFLDVVAPIAGALLAVVPGVGLLAAHGLLGGAGAGLGLSTATAGALGAAGGSLLNSGLQNQNSAEAFKKAALAAAGTYVGAKLGEIVKGGTGVAGGATKSLQANMTDLQSALVDGLTDEQSILGMAGFGRSAAEISKIIGISQDVVSSIISGANPAAITEAVGKIAANAGSSAAADLTITALTKGTEGALTSAVAGGAGSAVVGGLTAGTSGATNAATNTATNTTAKTQSDLNAANDAATNTVQVTGTGTPVDTNVGLEIAGGLGGNGITSGVTSGTNTDFKVDTGKNDAELKVEGKKEPTPAEKPVVGIDPNLAVNPGTPVNLTPDTTVVPAEKPKDLRVEGPVTQAALNDALTNGISDLTVTAPRPTTPIKVEPLQAPDPKVDAITAGLNGLLGEPTPKTPMEKTQDWIKAHPLEAASLGLTLIGGLGGAAGGGSGGGTGTNTLGYPEGNQPGTPGSLTDIFKTKLPTGTGSGFGVTPRDMGQRDWLRYGFGPEASFFSNVPDRQAPLAVNPAPVAQVAPVATTTTAPVAQTSPLAVNPTPAPAIQEMPALSEKLNEPTPDLAVKVNESGMPPPEEITVPAPASNQYTEAQWAALERSDPTAYRDAIMSGEHGGRKMYARGGPTGGTSHKPRTEFAVHGAGTGRSDDIPAVLSDGEYVMDAETVALLGDGSSKAGAEKLDQLRVNLRRHKGANLAKGRFSVNARSPEKYLAGGRV